MGAPVYHKSTAPATAGRSLINQLINVKVYADHKTGDVLDVKE